MADYEMTQAELDELIAASQPVRYMVFGGVAPPTPQENANRAWEALGKELGFLHMTVLPTGKGDRFFTAEVAPGAKENAT